VKGKSSGFRIDLEPLRHLGDRGALPGGGVGDLDRQEGLRDKGRLEALEQVCACCARDGLGGGPFGAASCLQSRGLIVLKDTHCSSVSMIDSRGGVGYSVPGLCGEYCLFLGDHS